MVLLLVTRKTGKFHWKASGLAAGEGRKLSGSALWHPGRGEELINWVGCVTSNIRILPRIQPANGEVIWYMGCNRRDYTIEVLPNSSIVGSILCMYFLEEVLPLAFLCFPMHHVFSATNRLSFALYLHMFHIVANQERLSIPLDVKK